MGPKKGDSLRPETRIRRTTVLRRERVLSIAGRYRSLVEELGEVRSSFPSPEDINDNPDTAPSKRIKMLLPEYQKVVAGPLIAKETGLDTIRAECPRFADWLAKLESLGGPLDSL